MLIKLCFTLFIFLFSFSFSAQDLEYVKKQAEILSADKMRGRGYVKNGLKKSANHIGSEFKKMGLTPLNNNYYQEFTHPVNTFPKKLMVKVNGKALVPGIDFMVSPYSGFNKGEYRVRHITKDNISTLWTAKDVLTIYLLDPFGIQDKDSLQEFKGLLNKFAQRGIGPILWVNHNRLLWSVGTQHYKYAVIEVNPGLFHEGDMVNLNIKHKFTEKFSAKNVLGYIQGAEQPDSFIVFTAHYDHLGMMGKKATFNGANDNASGVAFMMSMAKHYIKNPEKYSILFIAFAGEEAGLIGSKYYTEHPIIPLEKMKFLINMDLLGYGEEGIAIVNATLHEKETNIIEELNSEGNLFAKIKKRGAAANSDHYWFEEGGVPSFFIYTMGGNQAYHDVYDRYENLTFAEYDDLFGMLLKFVKKL